MAKIATSDLSIIVKGAIQMAHQDKKVVIEEESLIKQIIEAGRLDESEFENLKATGNIDIKNLCQQLSDDRAKKVFLLTLFAVANVDEDFDDAERALLDDLSQELGVGKIKVNEQTIKACKKEVLKLLAQN